MERKGYEKELRKLQVELCRLQEWVKANGVRIIIVFEACSSGSLRGSSSRFYPAT